MDPCFYVIAWTPRPLEFFRFRYVPLIVLQTIDDSATADEDYVPKDSLNISIDGYQHEEVIIDIVDDRQVEENEIFVVEITGADVGEGITDVNITIADNDRKKTL